MGKDQSNVLGLSICPICFCEFGDALCVEYITSSSSLSNWWLFHYLLVAVWPALSQAVSSNIPITAPETESPRSAMPKVLLFEYLSVFCSHLFSRFKYWYLRGPRHWRCDIDLRGMCVLNKFYDRTSTPPSRYIHRACMCTLGIQTIGCCFFCDQHGGVWLNFLVLILTVWHWLAISRCDHLNPNVVYVWNHR